MKDIKTTQELSIIEKRRLANRLSYQRNKDAAKIRSQINYRKNKETFKQRAKERYIKNRTHLAKYAKEYQLRNSEQIKIYHKDYNKQNKQSQREYNKQHYKLNKKIINERARERYTQNKEAISKKAKIYVQCNKEARSQYYREYCLRNKKRLEEQNSKYRKKHKEKARARSRAFYIKNKTILNERRKYRLKNDIQFRIRYYISGRINSAIKNCKDTKSYKTRSGTLELLGCSLIEAKKHLENQFLPGMHWGNHSTNGWHIDHIKPCNTFDLRDIKQQKLCFHYTNLRPLWAPENLSRPKDGSDILEQVTDNLIIYLFQEV